MNTNAKFPELFKKFILNFADFYHQYKVENEKLSTVRYRINSSLSYFKESGKIELAHTDRPGDFLPSLTLLEIKKNHDILEGMHPIDVNSINDLYYLSQDKISKLTISENKIHVMSENGQHFEYDINHNFNHENVISKRVSFLIGYMQAEKLMINAYSDKNERYAVISDNISTLEILDRTTNKKTLKSPLNILFTDEYKYYSKEDISRIGFICGQMSKL